PLCPCTPLVRPLVVPLGQVRRTDVPAVGGKNASLGEMVSALSSHGIRVPGGFATTAQAYWRYIDANRLQPVIDAAIGDWHAGRIELAEAGRRIREAFMAGRWPPECEAAILAEYRRLGRGPAPASVAVRSSATAEDLPEASFAGQLESFLNIAGEQALLHATRRCLASLYTDRAISYRQARGFGQS